MGAPKGYEYISGEVCIVRDAAILFWDGGDKKVWIPKSQIEDPTEFEVGETIELLIPEWLAGEKGLI